MASGNLAHFAVHFPSSAVHADLSVAHKTLRMKHLRGQIHGKYRTKTRERPSPPHAPTTNGHRARNPRLFVRFLFGPRKPIWYTAKTRSKCKLLLHLGNFRAFSVDNDYCLTYDFCTDISPKWRVQFLLSPFNPVVFPHGDWSKRTSMFLTQEEPQNLMPATAAARPDQRCTEPRESVAGIQGTPGAFSAHYQCLGSAAHDLKTPLSILNGYVELLQSEKLGPLSERQQEVLRDMQASGQRLQQFIQDFLTYSALETGGLRMQFASGNINDCLSEVCRMWSNRFQEKGLALYFLANDKLPAFPFDSPKLERVISNLLENSFKFTHKAEPYGCMPNRTCGNAAPPRFPPQPNAAART